MSKGTKAYSLRISDDDMAQIEETIARRNSFSADEPWDWSKFVRIAIREKINKMRRSRNKAAIYRTPAQLQDE